jgi:hypothetical protein
MKLIDRKVCAPVPAFSQVDLDALSAVKPMKDGLTRRDQGSGACRRGGARFVALLMGLAAGAVGVLGVPMAAAQNLGTVALGSWSSATTVTVRFAATGTLSNILVSTQGTANLDFSSTGGGTCALSTGYSSGASCTVRVIFSPTSPGLRLGAVALLNSSGDLLGTGYVSGTGTGSLLRYNPGTQAVLYSALNSPQAMVVDAGNNIYVADTSNARVLKFSWNATTSSYGSPAVPELIDANYWQAPTGVAVDGAGNLFVADMNLNEVVEFPWTGSSYGPLIPIGAYTFAQDLTIDGSGNLYILTSGSTITELPWNGAGYAGAISIGSNLSGSQYSTDFVDSSGNIFVADFGTGNVVKETYVSSGNYQQDILGNWGADSADGVATDPAGDIYVAVWAAIGASPVGEVVMLPRTGTGPTDYGTPVPLTSSSPLAGTYSVGLEAIYLDGVGNIYIEDYNNNLVEKWSVTDLPTLTFPTHTAVGSPDTADNSQTVSLMNVGNAPLVMAVPGSGLNPSFPDGFSFAGSSTCPQLNSGSNPYPLTTATSCTYAVDFSPVEENTNTGSLVLTDNYLGATSATQSIGLSGTGISQVTKLAFGTPPATPISVGGNAGGAVTVDEEKSSGVLDTAWSDLITLTVTGPGSYSQTHTATAVEGVATFNLSGVALSALGSYTYTASHTSVTSATATETVSNATPQTISFSPASPVTYGIAPITLSATGGASGNPVTFSILSGGSSGSLSGTNNSTLTITGTGTITIAANQAGGGSYSAASQVTANIVVSGLSQTIAFAPSSPVTFGIAPITLSATGGASGNPVTFSYVSGPGTLSGSTLTVTGAGTIAIAANQAGNSSYAAATQVTASIAVSKDSVTVGVTSSLNPSAYGQSVTFTATVNGGIIAPTGSVQFEVDGVNLGTAVALGAANGVSKTATRLAADTMSIAGSPHTVLANYLDTDGNFNDNTGTLGGGQTVTLATQATLTVTGMPGTAQVYGTTFTVGSSGGSGQGAVTFAATGSCSIAGATVTMTSGAGTCSVTATKAAFGNYASASSATATVSAMLATQSTLTVAGVPVIAQSYGASFTVGSSGGSGTGAVTFAATGNCSISGAIVTIASGTGTCSVTATKATDGNYASATSAAATVSAMLATQVALTVTGVPVIAQSYGASFTVGSSGGSGTGAVTFAATGSCSISGTTVTIASGTGTCSVTATKAADGNYASAASALVTVLASKTAATISVWPAASSITFGQTLASSTLSGGASLVSGAFAFTAPGTAPTAGTASHGVTFTPADSTDYTATTGAASVIVNKATPTVPVWPTASSIAYGQTVAASSLTGGTASVSGTFAWTTFTATPPVGTSFESVTFTPTDTTDYNTVTGPAGVTVSKAAAAVVLSNLVQTYTGSVLAPTATTTPANLAVSLAYTKNGLAEISPTSAGSYGVTATITAGNYSGIATGTLIVNQATQTIAFTAPTSPVIYGVSPIALAATGGASGNAVIFSVVSGPGSIGGITGGTLAITGTGTVIVAANQAGNTNYSAASQVTRSIVANSVNLNFNVTGLAFSSVPLGSTSAAQTLILTNPNGEAVTVSGIATTGDFSAANNCPTIAAFATCSVNITFTPTAAGARSGTVSVSEAYSNTPQSIPLTGIGSAAGIQVTPSLLSFGSQVVATTGNGGTISIMNTGTADLIISNLVTSGDFAAGGTCASIPAGSNCSLTVTFTPTTTGARAGTLTLTDNVGGGSQNQVVNLSGIGSQAGATLTPSVQTFPGTLVGASSIALNATLTNTGTAPLTSIGVSILGDFTQTGACAATLAPAATCIISVTYSPTVAGMESGTLIVTDSLGTQTVSLVGTGLAPGASLNAAQLVYGGQLVSTSSLAQTVIFTNTGNAAVSIASVVPTSNFTDTTNCSGSIAAGASCSVNVFFTPTATGPLSGTLTVVDGVGTQIVTMQGQGVSKGLAVSPSFAIFGDQEAETTGQAQTLIVTNTGTAALTLNPIAASNNFNATNQCPVILPAAASCAISVSFSPTAIGMLAGSLVVSDATGLVSTLATLSGQGTLPGLATSPATLSFGSLPVGTASQGQTVTVTNSGSAPLLIGTVSGTGDFAETDTCSSQTIAPGSNCVISVVMTPTTIGTRTGTIQFNDNADGAHQIALSGVGQQTGVSVFPTSLAFGSLPFVSNALTSSATGTSLRVTISNTGNTALQLGGFSTQGDFTESDSCGSAIAVGGTCTLTVQFVPTALGHRTGTLTITDNAGGGTQSVSLQGDGSPAGLTLSPPVLNFGVQTRGGTSAVQTATLTNSTGQSIDNLAIVASGEFGESDNCGTTLANGANCTLNITVTPQTTGAITGTISISSAGSAPAIAQVARVRADGASSSAISNPGFNVGVVAVLASTIGNGNAAAAQLTFDTAPTSSLTAGGNAGSSITVQEDDINWNPVNAADVINITVTGPGGYSKTYTATASGGIATFNLGGYPLAASGGYAYTASVQSNASIKTAAAGETVNAGAAARVGVTSGSGQSVVIDTAFASPLQVLVTDAYSNPVSGATVTFTGPGTGAGVSLSSGSSVTSIAGTAGVTATANANAGSYTVTAAVNGATTASFSLTNAKATPTIAWATPAAISQGTALGATQLGASAGGIAGVFVYTPAAGTVLNAGQRTLSVTFTPTDTADYNTVSGSVSIAVNQVGSTVGLAASTNESMLTTAVTFTSTVSRLSGTPTGTVNFQDGATVLGSGTLSAGICTFTTSSLAAGSHAITAVYSGDANDTASSSSALTQLVVDFAVNAGSGGSGAAQTVIPGGSATYTISLAPTTGTALPTAAILTVTGLPIGATATLTPSTWTPLTAFSWQLPANTALSGVSLTFDTPLQTTSARNPAGPDGFTRKLPPLLLGLLLLPFAGKLRRAGKRLGSTICLLLLLAAGAAAMTGCAGGNGFFAQPQKAYTVVVTVTAGSLSHSTNVTLTVQ